MITPLLFAFLSMQPPAAREARQLEQEVQQLRNQVNQLGQTMDQMQRSIREELKPGCDARVAWQPPADLTARGSEAAVPVSLISMVSEPGDACLEAEVRITANYFDANGLFICGGTLSLPQNQHVLNSYFEFRPFLPDYFAKWRDGPTWEQSNFHRLTCLDRSGLEVRNMENHVRRLRLYATVFPKRGGLATAEIEIPLLDPQGQLQSAPPRFLQ